jgi:hypothetical protein
MGRVQSLYTSKDLRMDNASFQEHSRWIGEFIVLVTKDRSQTVITQEEVINMWFAVSNLSTPDPF